MFRVSVAEIVVFLLLVVGVYGTAPAFFEFPLVIVTIVVLGAATLWLWFYLRLHLAKVVIVQGLGVSLLSKDFQTAPIRPNPQVWTKISSLRNTHITVIYWNYSKDFQENLMKHFNLPQYFDKEFYPSDFVTNDPKLYLQKICSALGVSPSKVVLIETDDKAITAGKSLGMTTIQYSSPDKLAADLHAKGL